VLRYSCKYPHLCLIIPVFQNETKRKREERREKREETWVEFIDRKGFGREFVGEFIPLP